MKDMTDGKKELENLKKKRAGRSAMKIPVRADKPKHYEATASIYVDGLSILCPNHKTQTTEIAFITEDHTPVAVKVYKSGCQPLWSHKCPEDEKVKIEINKSNSKEIGSLYKDSKKYDEDFEWMPDLNGSDWFPGSKIEIRPGAKDHLSAKLILKDAQFYTFLKSEHDALQHGKGDKPVNIGRIGRVLGADIICGKGDQEVTIRIESSSGAVVVKSLQKSEGPFFISIATKPIKEEESHLPHIYHHIITLEPDQPEYDFQYEEKEKDWNLCEEVMRVTTFACQTFPGGDGPLPEFP